MTLSSVHPRAGGEHVAALLPILKDIRFIPARAGNTRFTRAAASTSTVHPRAGGEHGEVTAWWSLWTGSSPRGRGTRSTTSRAPARRAVHPRAGGEHTAAHSGEDACTGSSPRGRGTQRWAYRTLTEIRFIPARAGNTVRRRSSRLAAPVHPRAGGEHLIHQRVAPTHYGSSPRGRGTHTTVVKPHSCTRFIPARAGNTGPRTRRPRCATVHPRAGGEHSWSLRRGRSSAGSSPRGRGTRRPDEFKFSPARFIPARAGNTSPTHFVPPFTTVHPRAGGEHHPHPPCALAVDGSSPRGRGTPTAGTDTPRANRFIPARAGNTPTAGSPETAWPVHPRAGGEHYWHSCQIRRDDGSSPRGRGTRGHRVRAHSSLRFIPARAGNTLRLSRGRRRRSVHPRAGGEHIGVGVPTSQTYGSSPRGRGTRLASEGPFLLRRFIPARAGNTPGLSGPARRDTVHPRAGGEHFDDVRAA